MLVVYLCLKTWPYRTLLEIAYSVTGPGGKTFICHEWELAVHNLHVEENAACPLFAVHIYCLFQVLDRANVSVQLILHDDNVMSFAENMLRLDSIYQYMRDTRRFERIIWGLNDKV